MILVAGSTGFLGREICRRLLKAGHPVRALVRATSDPDTVRELRAMGAELVLGDLRDPVSLSRACAGATAAVSTATTTRTRQQGDGIEQTDQRGQLNLIDAAAAERVDRFVLVSHSGNIRSDDPLTRAKRAAEQRLRQSGIPFNILRPTMFMEAWLSPVLGFDFPNARATLYGDGNQPISWISQSDVAAFAVHCLEDPEARAEVLELGGPEALSPLQAVRIFEQASGRPFQVQTVPVEALQAQFQRAASTLERSFAALMLAYAAGDPVPMDNVLQRYPVRLRGVRDYARQVVSIPIAPPSA